MIRRAQAVLREDGLLALFFRMLGETVYRRVLLIESDLRSAAYRADERCRWLRPEEAAEIAGFHPAIPEAEVRRRLAQGQRCWVLERDGRMAHALWVTGGSAWIEYLEMELPLEQGEAYVFNSYTPREQRGRGFASAALSAVRQALQQEGYTRVAGCIQPDRSVAYPPVYRAGFRPYGYLGWCGIGGWRRTFRRATDRFPFYAPSNAPREGDEE